MSTQTLRARFLLLVLFGVFSFLFSNGQVRAFSNVIQTQEFVHQAAIAYQGGISDGVITDFHSDISLDNRGNATIVENIVVYFPFEKHGIYRWIPNEVVISETGKKLKQPITIKSISYIKLPERNATGFSARAGDSASYTKSTSQGNYSVFKIGEPNAYLLGAYQYTISYTMKNAIRFQNGYQELYLNITGDQWEIPILKASATITPLTGVTETKCYTGASGSTASNCVISKANSDNTSNTTTPAHIAAEGLTVALKFTDGTFKPPTLLEKVLALILPLSPLLLPLMAFIYGYNTWKKYGKDNNKFSIPPIFVPTKEMEKENLSIQASLLAMRAKPVATLAELIRIAERGYLTISYLNNKVTLQLDEEQQQSLPEFMKTQPESLRKTIEVLTNDYSPETNISSLKNVYTSIEQATRSAAKEFKDTPYITDVSENLQVRIGTYSGLSFAAAIGLFVWFTKMESFDWILLPISLLLCGIIFAIVAIGMLKRTEVGDSLYRDLLGLKKYIKTAEVRRLEFFNNPKKMIAHFEQILPYAVILGLDKQWTKEFGPVLEQLKYEPTWMSSNIPIYNALPRVYAGMSSQMSSSMAKISTPPQSSGSSFGGGGGGFSGGGSGGGGGGSW